MALRLGIFSGLFLAGIKMYYTTLTVSETVNGKFSPLGEISVPMFDLADFGLPIPADCTDKDGSPIYNGATANWMHKALCAAVMRKAKNSLVPKTLQLKPGLSLANTVVELTKVSAHSLAEAGLAWKKFYAAFQVYLETQSGKTVPVQATYLRLVKSRDGLATASQKWVDGMLRQLDGFLAQSPVAGEFSREIEILTDICNGGTIEDGDI